MTATKLLLCGYFPRLPR